MKINTHSILLFSVTIILYGCSTSPRYNSLPEITDSMVSDIETINSNSQYDSTTGYNLVNLKFTRSNIDWKKFSTIYIRELKVTDEAKDASPDSPMKRRHSSESWVVPEEDIKMMQQEYTKLISQSLASAGYTIADSPQSNTLIIGTMVKDIYLTAPVEKSRHTYKSGGMTYTDGSGSITIDALFADGETLQVLAYIEDETFASTAWSQNTRLSNISDIKQLYKLWGELLVKGLNKAHGKQ